jgi:hypothetical protein
MMIDNASLGPTYNNNNNNNTCFWHICSTLTIHYIARGRHAWDHSRHPVLYAHILYYYTLPLFLRFINDVNTKRALDGVATRVTMFSQFNILQCTYIQCIKITIFDTCKITQTENTTGNLSTRKWKTDLLHYYYYYYYY